MTLDIALDSSYLTKGLVAGMLSAMIRERAAEYPELLADVEAPDYRLGAQAELFDWRFPACFARINEHRYDPNQYITEVSERFSISPPMY